MVYVIFVYFTLVTCYKTHIKQKINKNVERLPFADDSRRLACEIIN